MGRPRNQTIAQAEAGPHPEGKKRRGRPPLTPEERQARQSLMLARRLTNHYVDEIAKEFRCSEDTVYREIAKARRNGQLDAAVNYLQNTLSQKALAVYAKEL